MTSENIDMASKDLWERAKTIYLSTLRTEEEIAQAESYFAMISSLSMKDGVLTIKTSNKFSADFLREKYADKLKTSLDLAGGDKNLLINFDYDPNSKTEIYIPKVEPVPRKQEPVAEIPQRTSIFKSTLPLEENYTFEEFVQGSSNSWAFCMRSSSRMWEYRSVTIFDWA